MSEFSVSADMLAYVAGGLFVVGYLIINQIKLRILLLVGTGFYIWYYSVVAATPLWEAILMSSLTGLANLIGLFQLFMSRSKWAIPQGYREIFPLFPGLLPGDFRRLLACAQVKYVPEGTILAEEGRVSPDLHYVLQGQCRIQKGNSEFLFSTRGFIGEVGYMLYQPASATVLAMQDVRVIVWDVATARQRATRDPRFRLALDALMARDLALKVKYSVAQDHTTTAPNPSPNPSPPRVLEQVEQSAVAVK